MSETIRSTGGPAAARPFVDDPAGTLAALVRQMRAFWVAALAPWLARMSAVLESEIASRARRLVAAGPQAAFTGLHQAVRWDHDALVVHPTTKAPADVDLAGRGWGDRDQIVDADYGRACAAAIPMARFQLPTATGHSPQLETPTRSTGPFGTAPTPTSPPSRAEPRS